MNTLFATLQPSPVSGVSLRAFRFPFAFVVHFSAESALEADNRLFAQSTLQAINGARSRHGATPVVLNDELAMIAQSAAETMARHCKLEHTPPEMRAYQGQILGENYMATFQSELTGEFPFAMRRRRTNAFSSVFRNENGGEVDERGTSIHVWL